jgi:hypothetical protein
VAPSRSARCARRTALPRVINHCQPPLPTAGPLLTGLRSKYAM